MTSARNAQSWNWSRWLTFIPDLLQIPVQWLPPRECWFWTREKKELCCRTEPFSLTHKIVTLCFLEVADGQLPRTESLSFSLLGIKTNRGNILHLITPYLMLEGQFKNKSNTLTRVLNERHLKNKISTVSIYIYEQCNDWLSWLAAEVPQQACSFRREHLGSSPAQVTEEHDKPGHSTQPYARVPAVRSWAYWVCDKVLANPTLDHQIQPGLRCGFTKHSTVLSRCRTTTLSTALTTALSTAPLCSPLLRSHEYTGGGEDGGLVYPVSACHLLAPLSWGSCVCAEEFWKEWRYQNAGRSPTTYKLDSVSCWYKFSHARGEKCWFHASLGTGLCPVALLIIMQLNPGQFNTQRQN